MKICFIGKYPPIQGGVSRDNFWASYALAKKGFEIHIVTNAQEVEKEFRIFDQNWDPNQQKGNPLYAMENIKIHYPTLSENLGYIPWANPYVTKLASMANDVINTFGCDLIFSYYLEPYALSGYLASQWTRIPYGIRHAGSDIGRLLPSKALRSAYVNVLRSADYLFASRTSFRRFLSLGIDLDRLYPIVPFSLPTEWFNPSSNPLNVNRMLGLVRETLSPEYFDGAIHRLSNKPFDPSLPTIGIYGKVGRSKGSFDLVRALGKLKIKGGRFNFLALTQGYTQTLREFVKCVEDNSLEDVTWLLPFIPHWYIPSFIRTCTAICFLERNFPIQSHSPIIPREVMACGICLILSTEIAEKQSYRNRFENGSNVVIIDPLNTDELVATLAKVVEDPMRCQAIGLNGYRDISLMLEDFESYAEESASVFTQIARDVANRRRETSVREVFSHLRNLGVPFLTASKSKWITNQDIGSEGYILENIETKLMSIISVSYKEKYLKLFKSAYPMTFMLVRAEPDEFYDSYLHSRFFDPTAASIDHILRFGEFMALTVSNREVYPSYATDLVKYERLHFLAKVIPSSNDSLETINTKIAKPPSTVSVNSFLSLHEDSMIDSFAYNIVKVIANMREGKWPVELQEGEFSFVFQRVPNSFAPKVFAISSATSRIIQICDGTRSVAKIITEMEQTLGNSEIKSEVIQILNTLVSLRILEIKR